MQPYVNPNYFSNYQQPQINPYQQRMDFLQNYQQNLQQPVQQMPQANQQMNVIGKIVDSVDIVKATDIPMDGNIYYFPKADGTEIFGKQWLMNGQTRILTFKPVLEDDPSNLPNEDEKTKIEPFREFTEVFEKRFDDLENRIDEVLAQSLTKSLTKTAKSSTKKESVENE